MYCRQHSLHTLWNVLALLTNTCQLWAPPYHNVTAHEEGALPHHNVTGNTTVDHHVILKERSQWHTRTCTHTYTDAVLVRANSACMM